jgi:hypothetical protein
MDAVIYPASIKTDRDKLAANYSLFQQYLDEHNRVVGTLRDRQKISNYVRESKKVANALLAERSRLIENIRPKNWAEITRGLRQEELDELYISLFGDKDQGRLLKTAAASPVLEALKVIDVDSLPDLEVPPDPYEDFTTYTEVDPGTYLDRTSTRTTFTHINNNINAYVYKDKGDHHFNVTFEHRFKVCLTYRLSYNYCGVVWHALKQTVESSVSLHSQEFHTYSSTSGYRFYVYQRGGGGGTQDYTGYMTTGTVYYIEFQWDSSVGTYGTLYGRIATGTYYSQGGTLVDILIVACDELADFRYCYSICSWNYADSGSDMSGYMEYLDLMEVPAPVYPVIGGTHVINVVGGDE